MSILDHGRNRDSLGSIRLATAKTEVPVPGFRNRDSNTLTVKTNCIYSLSITTYSDSLIIRKTFKLVFDVSFTLENNYLEECLVYSTNILD